MHTISICLAVLPLAYEAIAEDASPYAIAFLNSIAPLSVIYLAIGPQIYTFPMCLSIFKVSFIFVAIAVSLEASTMPHVVGPLALVNAILLVEHYTKTVALAVL
jgi:hypothetical protein